MGESLNTFFKKTFRFRLKSKKYYENKLERKSERKMKNICKFNKLILYVYSYLFYLFVFII